MVDGIFVAECMPLCGVVCISYPYTFLFSPSLPYDGDRTSTDGDVHTTRRITAGGRGAQYINQNLILLVAAVENLKLFPY